MKTILVPTDFSKNADNALNYAIVLAKKENAKIILLHAFHITFISPDIPMEFLEKEIKATEQEASKHLKSSYLKVIKSGEIKCEILNKQGFAVDLILDFIEKRKPDIVVMGTKGASGIKEMILGSNTAKVIEKAKCPVIAVPEAASFEGIKKITYATDYHTTDFFALKKLVYIAKLFKAKINILHVSDEEYTPETEKEFMLEFINKVSKKIDYDKISFQLIYGKNVEKKLEKYMGDKSTDLLVMSTRQRGLFDKLFGESITKKMAYHTKIPLMAFHYKQESVVFI